MPKIFIKERINIVNYENENQGLLYDSSNIDIEGGIINVELESDVAGWHQLNFDIPAFILSDGKRILNPLTKNIFPLSKIQYVREVMEDDKKTETILYFIVQPQDNSRDENGIVLYHYECVDYPRHVLSKMKNGLTIGEDTLDEDLSLTPNNEVPEIEGQSYWVKADVQSKIDFNSFDEVILWGDAKPGAFAYVRDTGKAYRLIGTDVDYYTINSDGSKNYENWYELKENQTYSIIEGNIVPEPVWCPDWEGYPLEPDINNYDYGAIGINDIDEVSVQFYWDTVWFSPDKKIGRYDGTLYVENSRLAYSIYKTTDYEFPENFMGTYFKIENVREDVASQVIGATAYVIETGTIFKYNGTDWENTYKNKREYFKVKEILKGKWTKLDPQLPYLQPNNAKNYLSYILKDTEWEVGDVDEFLVDTNTLEFDETGQVSPKKQELRLTLEISAENAYNAITELCNSFKAYPRFDHVNKKVHLKSVPGNDYGLNYVWKNNLSSSKIVQDGEKAVSKLWVYGGEDLTGQQVISECNRMHPDYYLADYLSLEDLKERVKNPKKDNYAKITKKNTWNILASNFKGEINDIENLPEQGEIGDYYFIVQENSYWIWNQDTLDWYDTYIDLPPIDETQEIVLESRYDWNGDEWQYKGQFYHWYETISPYGDNYIMDFSYFLDRQLITQEQIDDIKYNYILPISKINKKRVPLMNQYNSLNEQYLQWNNIYDESKISRDAIEQSLKTTYTIKEKDSNDLISIKEIGVYKYPPGADIKTSGWIKSEAIYSDTDCPEVDTYEQLKENYPNPKVGDLVKVKDEVMVYYYNSIITYDETISAYLGWKKEDVEAEGFDARLSTLLDSPLKDLTADSRGMGLFEKFREEELKEDPEREELAPWYNPPSNINDLPSGPISDPTSTSLAHTYYNSIGRYITEQLNMKDALDRLEQIENEISLNLEKQEILLNRVNRILADLRDKYGDFIVEGVFTDETMVWRYNLWYAGLEALKLYHRPLITYELGVIDVSGLPEYRTTTDNVYHDIVYLLNRPELVLPDPGDYCYVTDNSLGIVKEKANITSVIRNLSNPSQNSVTIATVDTNTEDLIGKLVTAANTIYSKQEIYNRSAIINADGTISTDSISNTLENNSGQINLSSQNGTVVVGESGITTIDRDNAKNRMQYTGKGIFASTNGGVTWQNIVNAGKISIKNLEAGSIDSNTISVSNIGHDSSIIIDGKGITALNYSGSVIDPSFEGRIGDKTSFFLDSKTGNAYFKGMIQAGAGDIGGWKINTSGLTTGNGNSFTGMSSTSSDYRFIAGGDTFDSAKFAVKPDGTLKASGANIEGVINASGGSFTGAIYAKSGKIGGWNINDNSLYSNSVALRSTSGSTDRAIEVNGGTFYVRNDGYIYGSRVNLNGQLYSSDGRIGGFYLSSSSLTSSIGGNVGTIGIYTDGRISFGNNYGWINSGTAGTWVQGNGTEYPCYVLDAYRRPSAEGASIRIHSVYGKTYISSDSSDGAGSSIGGSSLDASDVELASNNGSTRIYSKINSWIYGGRNLLLESLNSVSLWGPNTVHIGHKGNNFGADSDYIYIGGDNSRVYIKGSIYGGSSAGIKENITLLTEEEKNNLYDIYRKQKIYSFNYKKDYCDDNKQKHYGFILDEVENTDLKMLWNIHQDPKDENIKSYNPEDLSRTNYAVIKILQEKVEELKNEIDNLKKRVN